MPRVKDGWRLGRYGTWFVPDPHTPGSCRTCGAAIPLHRKWCGGRCETTYQERVFEPLTSDHVRRLALRRDGYACVLCGAAPVVERLPSGSVIIKSNHWEGGNGVYLEVDHIVAVADDPAKEFDLDNLRTLCRPCHGRRGAHPQSRRHRAISAHGQRRLEVLGGC